MSKCGSGPSADGGGKAASADLCASTAGCGGATPSTLPPEADDVEGPGGSTGCADLSIGSGPEAGGRAPWDPAGPPC